MGMHKFYRSQDGLVNLTPHEIILMDEGGKEIAKFPSRGLARCQVVREIVDWIMIIQPAYDGETEIRKVPVNSTFMGQVEGLPEPDGETFYIVSLAVAQAMSGKRSDLLVTDDTVRDENGKIVGCRAFARV